MSLILVHRVFGHLSIIEFNWNGEIALDSDPNCCGFSIVQGEMDIYIYIYIFFFFVAIVNSQYRLGPCPEIRASFFEGLGNHIGSRKIENPWQFLLACFNLRQIKPRKTGRPICNVPQ